MPKNDKIGLISLVALVAAEIVWLLWPTIRGDQEIATDDGGVFVHGDGVHVPAQPRDGDGAFRPATVDAFGGGMLPPIETTTGDQEREPPSNAPRAFLLIQKTSIAKVWA